MGVAEDGALVAREEPTNGLQRSVFRESGPAPPGDARQRTTSGDAHRPRSGAGVASPEPWLLRIDVAENRGLVARKEQARSGYNVACSGRGGPGPTTLEQAADCRRDIVSRRDRGLLELVVVRHGHVAGSEPHDGRVQLVESALGD